MKKIILLLLSCNYYIAYPQNVGIGTTTPVGKLEIKGTADTSQLVIDAFSPQSITHPLIRIRNASGIDIMHIHTNDSSNIFLGFKAGAKSLDPYANHNQDVLNTFVGSYAGYGNRSGVSNTAVGAYTLFRGDESYYNTAVGVSALYGNGTGVYNTAIGASSLYSNNNGQGNTAAGSNALYSSTSGYYNTAAGVSALAAVTTGSYNTAAGSNALNRTTTAQYNTALGYNAGASYDNGYNNVFLGSNADVTGPGLYNVIAIGNAASCTAVSQVTIGNSATNSYRAYANWSNISDGRYKKNVQENVPGLDFITQLRPVTYTLDATALDGFLHKNSKAAEPADNNLKITGNSFAKATNSSVKTPTNDAAKAMYNKVLQEKEKVVYTGFVAQEVETSAKKLGFIFSGIDAPANENDVYGLRYAEFVVPLVKAVQEQQQMITDMQKRIQLLEDQNKLLQQQINKH